VQGVNTLDRRVWRTASTQTRPPALGTRRGRRTCIGQVSGIKAYWSTTPVPSPLHRCASPNKGVSALPDASSTESATATTKHRLPLPQGPDPLLNNREFPIGCVPGLWITCRSVDPFSGVGYPDTL
jgi:hypothetical protein